MATCKLCGCQMYQSHVHGYGICTPEQPCVETTAPNAYDVTRIRKFASGATRDEDHYKTDYEGFFSPLVMERFGEYMNKNRTMKNGSLRDSDNWQKGIPLSAYMKSLIRHLMEAWKAHRGFSVKECLEDSLCAVLFNAQGYLYELLKKRECQVPNPVCETVTGRDCWKHTDTDTLTPEEEAAWNDSQAKYIKEDEDRTPFWGV